MSRDLHHYLIGLQIGSGIWPTGLCILQQISAKTGKWAAATTELNVRWLERIPAGETFPNIIKRAQKFLKLLTKDKEPRILDRDMISFERGIPKVIAEPANEYDEAGGPTLVCGVTTVGPAAIKLMRDRGLEPVSVIITNGIGESETDFNNWRCSRASLLGDLKTHLETGRLAVAEGLELREELARELGSVRLKAATFNATDPDSWSQQAGDDLVFAVALPVWWAGKETPMADGWSTSIDYTKTIDKGII